MSGTLDRVPEFDPRSGEHLWIMTACWKINPAKWTEGSEEVHLDTENMVALAGPGCFYCEKVYEPILKHRRCKGKP